MSGTSAGHVSVMLAEVLRTLAPQAGEVYLDGTFGGGGYSRAILEQADCTVWAIDRDPEAIAGARRSPRAFPAGCISFRVVSARCWSFSKLMASAPSMAWCSTSEFPPFRLTTHRAASAFAPMVRSICG